MSLVVTTGNYCFVRCDDPQCNKRIEHYNEKALIRLVHLCGWDQKGKLWLCPDCAKKIDQVSS
jgi:uncharacterized protein with PIN domain